MNRPGILVGGGAYEDREAICAVAEACKVPVFRTWNGLDVVTDDSPVYAGTVGTYGGPGRNFGIQNTDWLWILGSRVSGRITGGKPETFAREAKKIYSDIEYEKLIPALLPRVPKTDGVWLAQCREWVEKYDPVKPEMLDDFHHYGFVRRLSHELPSNAIIVYDTGGNAIMMGHCFQSKKGQRIFSSNGNTPMGFSMCGAIGAWFAEPERPVICLIGDGGMSLNIQELQTIKHYGCEVKVFILNNHCLGNTKAWQRVNKRKEVACGPDGYSCPDFIRIAQAYGVKTFSITRESFIDDDHSYRPNSLEENLPAALAYKGACVVDVVDDDRCTYEPRISRWDLPIEDMEPFLPRDEFKNNMYIEPLKGWEKNI